VKRSGARLADPGAELIDQLGEWWQQYGRIASSVVGAVAAAALLGFLYFRAQAATENTASGRLAEAEIMFWQGYYPRSYETAQQVIKQYPGTRSATEAHRVAGDDAFWRGEEGDFQKAVDDYRTYLAKRPRGMVSDGVRRSLAYALESNATALALSGRGAESAKQMQEAAAGYESLVGRFPDRESSAEFLISSARCYRALNQPAEAIKRLQRVVDEFGDTAGANRARVMMAEVKAGSR